MLNMVTAKCRLGNETFTFPFYTILPTDDKKHPFFIHVNFRSDIPDKHQPTEEIIDNGFALLTFNYEDITKDNGDFSDGLAGILYKNSERAGNDAGKIVDNKKLCSYLIFVKPREIRVIYIHTITLLSTL